LSLDPKDKLDSNFISETANPDFASGTTSNDLIRP